MYSPLVSRARTSASWLAKASLSAGLGEEKAAMGYAP